MSLLVVGSVAYDSIESPYGKKDEILGGSALYFSLAANYFTKVKLVAVVGEDFKKNHIKFLKNKGIDIKGLEIAKGKTFRWKGRYSADLNHRDTIYTHLNVFETFKPKLPANYKDCKYVFLANIDPDLQLEVLNQIKNPKLTACDTMNLWIDIKKKSLKKVLKKIMIFIVNDSEARQFSGEGNLIKAGERLLKMGPKMVIIKKGEHGAIIFGRKFKFFSAAYPLEDIMDTTGSGDVFAGGFMGYLSKTNKLNQSNFKKAVIYGSILASYNVEAFSVDKLRKLRKADINRRYREFEKLTRF
jgi:sugar/nucleoside kinase (ribokinase family)